MDINLLSARIKDLKELCQKTNSPKFIGFLTAEETATALKQLSLSDKYSIFGGYDGAERTVLAVLPDWCEETVFPITAITFAYRKNDSLTHRDFLGALMSLGVARETIGDILIEEGRAVTFVLNDVSKFVLTQIDKVGNVGVTLSGGYFEPLPQVSQKQSLSASVASVRLDCVVAAVCNLSRKQASQKIADGFVSVNSICVTKATINLRRGDKLTIRQKGKFQIVACDEYSKKGRMILKYDKYV